MSDVAHMIELKRHADTLAEWVETLATDDHCLLALADVELYYAYIRRVGQ